MLGMFKKQPTLLKAAVYGANDGIITTFAIVAGVAGAGLSSRVVLILGIANMIADGLSMGAGDFLGERSEHRLIKRQTGKKIPRRLWVSGMVTFVAFVLAGSLPLLPYFLESLSLLKIDNQFAASTVATLLALFVIGSLRHVLTKDGIIKNGLEMLAVGALAAGAAYGLGALVENFV